MAIHGDITDETITATETMERENPLIWPLLGLLQSSNRSWKINHLMEELQQKEIMPLFNKEDNNTVLFKKNFLIMNALYQLQQLLLPEYYLQVKAMDICLFSLLTKNNLPQKIEQQQDSALANYYLNWQNYDTSIDVIQQLLNSFWQRYSHYIGTDCQLPSRQQALKIFELNQESTANEIRKQWRKLALQYHPDRPFGDQQRFIKICAAWQILRENS